MPASPPPRARRKLTARLLALACLLLFPPLRAWGWGCDGHQAVALIAERHMTAHARRAADALLQRAPIAPSLGRFCSSQGLDPLTDASTWADDVRSVRPETGAWHYIDIPREAPRSAVTASCPAPEGCVVGALQEQIAVLRSASDDPRTRADALRFVIHLVADLHQPLHCVTNNDMGGNCVPIDFFDTAPMEKDLLRESYSPNLHSIWDSALIQRIRGNATVALWAASLDHDFHARADGWEKEGINLSAWAWESHQLADSMAYGRLPVPDPVEKPQLVRSCADDRHVSSRLLRLHERISEPYLNAVAPTVNQQIAQAGVRLAMLLNQVWP